MPVELAGAARYSMGVTDRLSASGCCGRPPAQPPRPTPRRRSFQAVEEFLDLAKCPDRTLRVDSQLVAVFVQQAHRWCAGHFVIGLDAVGTVPQVGEAEPVGVYE